MADRKTYNGSALNEEADRSMFARQIQRIADGAECIVASMDSKSVEAEIAGGILDRITRLTDAIANGALYLALRQSLAIGWAHQALTDIGILPERAKAEWKRARRQLTARICQKSDGQKKSGLARELFAKYSPGDIKRLGMKAVHKEIGQKIQDRLELAEVVAPETVRGYLKPKKSGEG